MKIQSKATQTVVADGDILVSKDLDFSHMDTATQFRRHIDQYNDKYRAVASEIMSNAIDENIFEIDKGKVPKPYEVHMPTDRSPNFIVRDYGRGMSAEQLVENVNPGKTEKNQDNVRLGGFGVGMIAPLCLADFVIKTRQDGVETTAHVTQDGGSGAPSIMITSKKQTDQPTGTDVIIPMTTHERADLTRAIREFLYYMPPKLRPKLVNWEGSPVVYFFDQKGIIDLRSEGIPVVASSDRSSGSWNSDVDFIIGFRPYSVRQLPTQALSSYRVIKNLLGTPRFIFPIGYLSVSDNRETLSLDRVTTERIIQHFEKMQDQIKQHFEKELRKAKNIGDAVEAAKVLVNAYQPVWTDNKNNTLEINRGWFSIKPEGVTDSYKAKVTIMAKLPPYRPYEITQSPGTTRAKSANVTGDPIGYRSEFLTENKKVPLFYREGCKNHVQRVKYWLEENIDAQINSYTIEIYDGKPEYLIKSYPNTFECINLDEVEVPKGEKGKARDRSLGAENMLMYIKKGKEHTYYNPRFSIKKSTRVPNDLYVSEDWYGDDLREVKCDKRIFYIPTLRNDIDNYYIKTEYSTWRHNINNAMKALLKVGALQEGDVVLALNSSERKTLNFKEAKKQGVVIDFFHYYKVVVEKTSLAKKTSQKGHEALDNFVQEYRARNDTGIKKQEHKDLYTKATTALYEYRTKQSDTLPWKHAYLDKVIKFKVEEDPKIKNLVAECKAATKWLEQFSYTKLLEFYLSKTGIKVEEKESE